MDTNKFVNRHVGISAEDIPAMLETIGVKSLDELIDQTIPANIRLKEPLNLPEAMTEREFAEHIAELASKNEVFTSYIGMGWYDTVCPAPIQRNVFENPVWYTSYTPYQAEVSQGRSRPRKIAVATDTQSITIAAAHFISPIRYGICVPEIGLSSSPSCSKRVYNCSHAWSVFNLFFSI